MNNATIAILVVAGLGVGFLAGSMASRTSNTTDIDTGEVADLHAKVAQLEAELGRRAASLSVGATLEGHSIREFVEESKKTGKPVVVDVWTDDGNPFDISKYENAEDAFAALMAYAQAMLAKGPEGHMALLKAINDTIFEKPGRDITRQLIPSEEEAARFIFPLIKFAMDNNVQVADMLETIYKTAAEDPAQLEDLDDDVLEIFTEGIAWVVPGMVGEERLKRLSTYAEAILAQDADKQPQSLQRNRRDIEQALRAWKPPVTPEEALEKLRSGKVSPEEINYLLRKVPAEMLTELDIDALIGPMLEKNPFQAMHLVHRIKPTGAVRAQLDQRVIRGTVAGSGHPQFIHYYLRYTGRLKWQDARAFIETGLAQSTSSKAMSHFAQAAISLTPGPDKDWVGWVLETYQVDAQVRKMLEGRLK